MPAAPGRLEQLANQIKELSETIAAEDAPGIPVQRAKQVRKTIADAYGRLRKVMDDLDPIKNPGFVFDPSNPNVAGRIAGIAMIAQPKRPLANIDKFYGSGVYALYYNGDFPAYAAISSREHPIYVGKADPTDAASKTATEQGDRLARRLRDHRKNIAKAANLRLEDVEYRALVIQTGWQTPAEDYLIHLFKPVWNSEVGICYGFGKHGDDSGTRAHPRSPWDTLHPGRDWAHRDPNIADAHQRDQIIEEIATHLAQNPPMGTVEEIIHRFIDEMRAMS